jgi:O-antigen/teichoic acid export membrane protein
MNPIAAEDAQLAAQARRGTHAVLATRVLSVLTTAASITILARLIPPADFGVWAMAAVPLALVTILREMGLMSSIVQAPSVTRQQQDAYFRASVFVSLAAAALLALAAPLLASVYDAPLLRPVLWACCIGLVVAGFGLVHAALLRRSLQYDKLVIIEGGGMLCGLAAGLATGYLWRDVWAFVAGYFASAVWMSASALVLSRRVPKLPGDAPAKLDMAFSLQVALSNLLAYLGSNIGLLVGCRFSAAELGFFYRGQQLFNLGHFALLTPLTEVGFAMLCRLRAERAYRDAYTALARRVAVLFIPYAAVLPIVAADLIRALLGPTWDPAAPVLAWFAPAVAGQAIAALFAQLMMSQGRGRELRNWAIADLLLRAAGAMLGSRYGIVGMAAGFSLATLLNVPLMLWIAGRSGPVTLRHQLAALWPGVALAAAAALAAGAAALALVEVPLGPGWSWLVLIGGSAALAWTLLCLILRPARDALLGRSLAHA